MLRGSVPTESTGGMQHRCRKPGALGGLALEAVMTDSAPHLEAPAGPPVVVLTDCWESTTEPGWITRQVAGALACVADVHVMTVDDAHTGTTTDSVFTVHRTNRRLATRDIEEVVGKRPAAVLLAGRQWLGLADLVDRIGVNDEVPISVLALAAEWDDQDPNTGVPALDRAGSILVVTDDGREALADFPGGHGPVHVIDAPLAANPSAGSEPDPLVGYAAYVVVHTDVDERAADPAVELAQLVRITFPDRVVAVLHTDACCVWRRGRVDRTEPIHRPSDIARLTAWARVTVDLRPGRLFARRCLESLLFGTPIVVPFDSRARGHAERSGGGLWFTSPTELIWCIEAMFDPAIREALSDQGRIFAERRFGSTDGFIERVLRASGLAPTALETLTGQVGRG